LQEGRAGRKRRAEEETGGPSCWGWTARGDDQWLPQVPELHEPELQPPPPPRGRVELMLKPERYPASTKSILMLPQESRRLSSTRKVRLSSLKTLSLAFGSSRASPREGPAQPPCIRATRMAESILFCSRYDFRFFAAESVTCNIGPPLSARCDDFITGQRRAQAGEKSCLCRSCFRGVSCKIRRKNDAVNALSVRFLIGPGWKRGGEKACALPSWLLK